MNWSSMFHVYISKHIYGYDHDVGLNETCNFKFKITFIIILKVSSIIIET